MKKFILIIVINIIGIIPLTGCWDKKELNTVGIVYAVTLDNYKNTNKIECAIQVVRPSALRKYSNEPTIEIISDRGNTVYEAMRNMQRHFDRTIIFSHNKVIIISERLARKGILHILDYFKRNYASNNIEWIVVSKSKNVKQIIGVENGMANIQGIYLENIIKECKNSSKVTCINLMDFYRLSLSPLTNPVAGVAEVLKEPQFPAERGSIGGKKGIKFFGTAVFKRDKLIGYLNETETQGFNWIRGEVKECGISIPSINNPKKYVGITIKSTVSNIKPLIKNGEISFDINIKQWGDITELDDNMDVSKIEVLKKIENKQKEIIKKQVEVALMKLQKELDSDIVGFGRAFSKKYPKLWKKQQKNWNKTFQTVKYKVNIKVTLDKTGLIFKAY